MQDPYDPGEFGILIGGHGKTGHTGPHVKRVLAHAPSYMGPVDVLRVYAANVRGLLQGWFASVRNDPPEMRQIHVDSADSAAPLVHQITPTIVPPGATLYQFDEQGDELSLRSDLKGFGMGNMDFTPYGAPQRTEWWAVGLQNPWGVGGSKRVDQGWYGGPLMEEWRQDLAESAAQFEDRYSLVDKSMYCDCSGNEKCY